MIFTLTDRHYNVLDAYETDDYLIGQYIGSILETLEINVLVKSLNAEHWVEGNYIMCKDKKGKKRWFTIYDCEDSHSGDVKSLFCYSGTIDIVAEDAAPISAPDPKPFKWYFDTIFYDTGIELGINEISDLSRKLEFTSENASNAEMLQYVLNGFDNAEASLDVEFDGSVPTKLVLNVYKRIGNEEPQAILSDEDDSLTSLDRKGSISDLATCINPTGAEDENGNPITLLGKYYEERDEQGNILYYSPVDSPRIFSVVAHQNFYVQLPGKANGEFDGYINRRYESQATTQDTLWQESLAQLKKIDHVAVTYEANGYIDCSIGDNVQIVSHEMKPPVMIAARTIEYKFNDDDPSRNVYKFGNYVELTSNLDDLAKIIAEVKKQVEPQVVEAERNAKIYAETISVEKAAQAEENAKVYAETKKQEAIQVAATDATNKANLAEQAARAYADSLKQQTDQQIKDVEQSLSDLDTYVDGAFKDSVIQEAEAKAIEKYLNQLNAEKADIDAKYNDVYNNPSLSGTAKTNLSSKKSAYNTAHTNLINAINTAISDGKTTPAEKSDVDTKFSSYRTALSQLSTAFEDAIDAIAQTKAQQAENNAKSHANSIAEQKKKEAINAAIADAETKINAAKSELEADIALKADAEWVNGQLVLKENVITKSNTAPANPTTGQLWLDTSVTPNVLKRWSGSAWVKASPTTAGEVGAYTKTEVDNALNSKVSVTQYNTDMNGVVTRLNSAESRITQTENEIATKVSNTTYQQDKTTINNNISQLTTRMGQAETELQQTSSQIALKANKTDVYTKTETDNKFTSVNQQISQLDAELSVQADQIATKVSKTEFESLQIGGRNLASKNNIGKWSSGWVEDNYVYTITGPDAGLYIKADAFKTGERYVLTFKAKKISGTVTSLAGHCTNYTIHQVIRDGVLQSTNWSSGLGTNPYPDDEEVHNYEIHFTAEDLSSGTNGFYIQPNRSHYGLNYVMKIWDLMLEKGNKATDWTPAPEDTQSQIDGLGSRVTTAETSITQLSNQIQLKANQSTVDTLANRISSAESTITLLSDEIDLKVDKNGVIAAINVSPETIKLSANKINLDGFVEAKHIKSLNGLNVGNGQFVVDANGNVKFAGNLEGASGTFGEVTVKDGDFYLKDTKSGIRYSLVKKTNILGDHSFELIKLSDPTSQDNIDHWWLPIITDNTNWEAIGAPRGVPISISGPGPADAMPIFGNRAILVNSTNYVEQPVWDITSNTQYTFSVHAKRPYNNTPGAVRIEVHYKKYNTDGTSTRQLVAAQSFDTVASDYSVSRHALTFTSPNVARTGSDEIIFVIKGVNANWVHVDGVQVVKSAYPTVYDTEDSLWSFMNSRNGFKARAIWTEGIYNGVNGIDIDDNRIRIYSNASLNYFSVENIESRFSTVPYDQWKDPEPNVKKSIKVNGGIATDVLYANTGSVSKNAIATNGKIFVGGEGIELSWVGGTPYIDFSRRAGVDFDMRLILETDSGLAIKSSDNIVRHKFYANGTKSGGTIEIDGKILGMSPIDSPQILIETIEFDVPLTETGTKVLLDTRFAKAVNYRFAVFPNNGRVIEKGANYFVIAGDGLADIRIVGERVGYAGVYFDDMEVA